MSLLSHFARGVHVANGASVCLSRLQAICIMALWPGIACAEVMDKEFSLSALVFWALLGPTITFLAARYRPRLLVATVPVLAAFFSLHLTELNDPFVGPAMRSEASAGYLLLSWAGPVLVLGCGLAGVFLRRRNARAGI